jgi:menaquinone-9 beta-reductase
VHRGRLALVGDASGSVDAIAGEGLCLAFKQSLALAGAIANDDLPAYQAAHNRIRFRPGMMSAMLLMMDRNHWLQTRALAALSTRPGIFAHMLATHVGAASTRDIATNMFELGWSILTV